MMMEEGLHHHGIHIWNERHIVWQTKVNGTSYQLYHCSIYFNSTTVIIRRCRTHQWYYYIIIESIGITLYTIRKQRKTLIWKGIERSWNSYSFYCSHFIGMGQKDPLCCIGIGGNYEIKMECHVTESSYSQLYLCQIGHVRIFFVNKT